MATKGAYIASGIAIAAAMLGFAGYKSMEARKSNDDQQLLATGSGEALASNSVGDNGEALPSGNSIGDGNPGGGPGNQPNTGSAMNGFQRGGGENGNPTMTPSQPRGDRSPGQNNGQEQPDQNGANPGGQNGGNNSEPGRPGGNPGRPPQGEMDYFGTGVMILSDAKVQTELKLSAAQKAAIGQVLQPPKAAASKEDMGAQVQDYMSRASEQGNKVKAILDVGQEKRYMQLVHQVMGPMMLMNGSAKEQFGISDDEVKKMTEIMQSYTAEFQKSMSSGQMPNLETIAKVKGEMDKKVLTALDSDSLSKWKAAVGAPFAFSSPMGLGGMMGGGMGGGFGGRRGGAPGGRRPGGN